MTSIFFNKEIINTNNYINNLVLKYKYIDNLENKIETIEEDYNLLIENIKSINLDEIDDILKNKTSLEILKKELSVIKLLSKYSLQNNELDYEFIKKCLNYCYKTSEFLRKSINQKSLKINHNDKNYLQRCSYKFCNFKENCNYNYNKKKNCFCYQDHYVHNMVSRDLFTLLKFIDSEHFKNIPKNEKIKEVLKSINTLSYVINHMENELKAKCLYQDKSKWDSYHIVNHYKK